VKAQRLQRRTGQTAGRFQPESEASFAKTILGGALRWIERKWRTLTYRPIVFLEGPTQRRPQSAAESVEKRRSRDRSRRI
jgi:hypothetical protein